MAASFVDAAMPALFLASLAFRVAAIFSILRFSATSDSFLVLLFMGLSALPGGLPPAPFLVLGTVDFGRLTTKSLLSEHNSFGGRQLYGIISMTKMTSGPLCVLWCCDFLAFWLNACQNELTFER